MSDQSNSNGKPVLLTMKGLRIEGRADETWNEIVHGIDLTLHRGEVLGLIGESGAGKSTVGLAAMGFTRDGCRISGGEIVFDGIDLMQASESTKRNLRGKRIAYVAQSAAASFNPAHKLMDQYCEAPVQHGVMGRSEAESDAVDLYRRMQLPDPETIGFRYPHQVSGGQLQRAMTAMAMACRPDLIIFDEPTTALDVSIQAQVLNLFVQLKQDYDLTYLFISHDIGVIEHISDRVIVMYLGRIVETAPIEAFVEQPNHPYTKALLEGVPRLEIGQRDYEPVSGEIPSPLDPPSGCHFHPRCKHSTERCKTVRPALIEIAPDHFSACHLNDSD